jgi:hypothetical protein
LALPHGQPLQAVTAPDARAHRATVGGGRKFNPLILSEIQNAGDKR